jgi:GNAT superfamily N-acetyltransferase
LSRTDGPLELVPASPGDAKALAELRVLAMRESLERVGRFDPARARSRFLSTFSAEATRHIEVAGVRVGFLIVVAEPDHLLLEHLYIHPERQGAGIGSAVLRRLFAEVDDQRTELRVGALRESDSNRFYMRHGFELVERAEWDNYYVRRASGTG